jgi:hypothetical protein
MTKYCSKMTEQCVKRGMVEHGSNQKMTEHCSNEESLSIIAKMVEFTVAKMTEFNIAK